MSIMSSPQRGFAPATIAYKAIILTAITMGAVKVLCYRGGFFLFKRFLTALSLTPNILPVAE